MIDRRSLIASALAYIGVRVPDPVHPDTLAARFAELERRLAAIERSPQLGRSSIRGGSLDILNTAGQLVARLGDISTGSGLEVFDGAGNVVLRAGAVSGGGYGLEVGNNPTGSGSNTYLSVTPTGGNGYPWEAHGWRKANDFVEITSGSYTTAWDCRIESIDGTSVKATVPWVTDSGTTGDVRLREVNSGAVTSAISLSASASGTAEFTWLHGLTVATGPRTFVVEARRLSGAGAVVIYTPSGLTVGRNNSATPTGI